MAWHTRAIDTYKCWCGKKATVWVYNPRNAPNGTYCKRHGDDEVDKHNKQDGLEL